MSKMNDAELRRRLEMLAGVQPSPEATARAMDRVRQMILTNERQQARKSLGRILMNSKWSKLAVAAVVALAVITGLSLSTGNGGKVYARAVDRLHGASTLTFSLVTMTGQQAMPTVRMDVAFREPDQIRIATADGYVTVAQRAADGMEGISIVPVTKSYVKIKADNLPADPSGDPWATTERLRALPAQADEVLGRRQIDGRALEGFRVREDDALTTVWIDPGTGELARVELEFPNTPGMNVIMSDFQVDIPLDDSLFSLEPPQGYTLVEVQADASTVKERDFVEFLRFWSVWTRDTTFPPMVAGAEIAKVAVQMAMEDKFVAPCPPGYEPAKQQDIMYRGLLFVAGLPTGTWRYAGQNVRFGDPATPIFWYQPAGSTTWRVIYADLHVADVTPENLPK